MEKLINASSFIPLFYARWLSAESGSDWLDGFIVPDETGAFDCQNCSMVDTPRGLTRDLGPFHRDLKCCTFHPYLPSYTIGALFVHFESQQTGRERLNRYLSLSRLDALGSHSKRKPTSVCETGKRIEDKCPFYMEGNCGIYAYRPSTCATYVCRSNLARRGQEKWRKFEARLAEFEWTLAHEVAFQQGYTMKDLRVPLSFESASEVQAAEKHYRQSYEIACRIENVFRPSSI